ncbi:MAG TPA: 16S rRNA (guanine(527)-N(7))-methyltransferase RsmG [Steroidobacteraceae bacterium]
MGGQDCGEQTQLIEGARALGVSLDAADAERMLRLLDELARWNRTYNLTAITQRAEMITHHLLDSLSVHGDLHGRAIADVGTGAGFPGLPLAIVNGDRQFTLIDSNNKKVRFVAHAVRTLSLTNVTVLHARVESLHPPAPFDTVIARAFAPLPELLEKVVSLCSPGTRILAMKGRRPDEELAAIPAGWRLAETRPLTIPGLNEARTLVVVERTG